MEKKTFCISVDFVMSKNFYIEAQNEEEAEAILESKIENSPYDFADDFNAMVSFEIIDIYED